MTWPSLRLTRRAVLWLLVVTLVLLAIEAWYPFRPELPLWRPSAPERSAEGVTFGGDGDRLASPAGMDWVAAAAATDRLAVRLEARTEQAVQQGPARLLAVSENHFQADLMVGQDGDDLVVRVRRPGSDPSGDPPFRVDDVFADDRWKALAVTVADNRMLVAVDGAARVDEPLEPDPLDGWAPTYKVSLGDDLAGERAWQGQLRQVDVQGGDGPSVDLLEAGVLETSGGWEVRGRVGDLGGRGSQDPVWLSALRVLAFVPVGAALRRLLRRPGRAAVAVALVTVLLTLGKAFVAGRHPSLADTVLATLGGLVGVALVDRMARQRRRGAGPSAGSDDDGAATAAPVAPAPSSPTELDRAATGPGASVNAPAPSDAS